MTPTALRTARKQLGLTQAELAAVLSLGAGGQGTVSRWERGDIALSGPVARLVSAYLDGYRPPDWPR
jgi:transcriptional regulator with XRE-family HTH domain